MKRSFLITLILLASGIHLFAQCMMIPLDLQEQVSNSSLIIEGEVISERAFETVNRDFIYTAYRVRIIKVFKGVTTNEMIEIVRPGGQVGETLVHVSPVLKVEPGFIGTFFLETARARGIPPEEKTYPLYRGYASQQSVFRYDRETGAVLGVFEKYENIEDRWYQIVTKLTRSPIKVINRSSFRIDTKTRMVATINNFTPTTITAGTYSELTINGTGFGPTRGTSVVEFRLNDDGVSWVSTSAVHYQSWNDTLIKVWIPYTAGTGQVRVTLEGGSPVTSAATLTVSYSEYNFEFLIGETTWLVQTEHQNDNGMGGYTFRYHTEFNNNVPARSAFERSLNSWRCETDVNWIIGNTTTIDMTVLDGQNVVRFDNGSELPAGVAGQATGYGNACWVAPFPSLHMMELDVIFNNSLPNGWTWEYGPALPGANEVDFESVSVHELGHAHQLGHLIDGNKVMHWEVGPNDHERIPNPIEITGAQDVHSRSTGNPSYCGYDPMTDFRRVKYVDGAAVGIGNGETWANAFPKLQDAIGTDACFDTLYIAKGTYYPDEGVVQTNNDQGSKFFLDEAMVLIGGYPTGGGARNLASNPTILSGDIEKDELVDAENSVTVLHITADAHVDGFIIEDGYADGSDELGRKGAGVYNLSNGVMRNCIIRNNKAVGNTGVIGQGGGFYHAGGSPELINILMYDNEATLSGGALKLIADSFECVNCTITDNTAPDGALNITNGAHIFRNSIFWNNGSDVGISDNGSSCDFAYTMFEDEGFTPGGFGANALFSTDPEFVNSALKDYLLGPCSPAYNSGNNTYNLTGKDLIGNNRKFGTIDRGALERQTLLPGTVVLNSANSGSGSLRQIILDACPDDVITFSNSLMDQTILLGVGGQIQLDDRNLTIQGLGMDHLLLSGNGASRIFSVDLGGSATIQDLNIIDGYVAGSNGGALWNRGILTLKNIHFIGNSAGQDPQAIGNQLGGELKFQGQVIIEN